jgi:hypothetical protein
MAEGGQVVAIMPDRALFAAELKSESEVPFPILADIDNGYALSLNLAFWVGAEEVIEEGRFIPLIGRTWGNHGFSRESGF